MMLQDSDCPVTGLEEQHGRSLVLCYTCMCYFSSNAPDDKGLVDWVSINPSTSSGAIGIVSLDRAICFH